MRIMILGADGYLGWPTVMAFAAQGHHLFAIDDYSRRRIAAETDSEALFETPKLPERARLFGSLGAKGIIEVSERDCSDYAFLSEAVRTFQPDAIVHYAEQPSAPYSMRDFSSGKFTLENNLGTTFAVLSAIREFSPNTHLIKLGTMGEYGTPNIDIEEGWLEVNHKGRSDTFLYPRQAGSLYHTTKVLDTDLIWFFVRTYGLRVTDLMQGPVYGLLTSQSSQDIRLYPNFHYDDIFGTVLNRFIVQAVAGIPLTVYGKGGQTRGYLNLLDTLKCVELAALNPPPPGSLNIYNQFTETFSVNDLAKRVAEGGRALGLQVDINHIPNPRKELEDHYYNPSFTALQKLGLVPTLLTTEVISDLISEVIKYRDRINVDRLMPRVRWS